jgi:phosphotransferase system enzyme I (PtsI)
MPLRPTTTTEGTLMIREAPSRGEHVLKGIPASAGLAIGKAVVLNVATGSSTPERIAAHEVDAELRRFREALEAVVAELVRASELARSESATVSSIIESFLLIVGDPVVTESICDRIRGGSSAESAVIAEYDAAKGTLVLANDPFLRERVQDVEHVKERVLAMLRNATLAHTVASDSIVVAGSITPQDLLFFKHSKTLGFVTEVGGINSHACILARDISLPAVIGIRSATTAIMTGQTIIVDGFAGVVVVDPDDATLQEYVQRHEALADHRRRLGELIGQPAQTIDGVGVKLYVNVDTPQQAVEAVMQGADGIGLVRTEFLLVQQGRYPTVEEQEEWYREIALRAFPLPVTFRAFDVGSDKFRIGIPHHEDNPALGLRGIRFLLFRPDIFEQQVCAVLRASANRNVRFMLPMVSVADEIVQAKAIINRCKERLRAEGIDYDAHMPLGIMVETPSAALMTESLAAHVDFLSIGSNDLTQYALATDRTNELVADIYDALHPSVLRLLAFIVDAANSMKKPVSLCGELAGHAVATEMLVGLGLHEFSVAPALLLELKSRIRSTTHAACVERAKAAVFQSSTADVYAVLSQERP